jgi:hypothetical protein
MTEVDALSLHEIVDWCGSGVTTQGAAQLRRLATSPPKRPNDRECRTQPAKLFGGGGRRKQVLGQVWQM